MGRWRYCVDLSDRLTPAEISTLERRGVLRAPDAILAKLTKAELREIRERGYRCPANQRPSRPVKSLLDQASQRGNRIIRAALKDLDEMRADLKIVRRNLFLAVEDYSPKAVRQDFKEFWRAGGCSLRQYDQWRAGKRSRDPVAQRRHLRLVADKPKPAPASPPRSPDDNRPNQFEPSIEGKMLEVRAKPIQRYRSPTAA